MENYNHDHSYTVEPHYQEVGYNKVIFMVAAL